MVQFSDVIISLIKLSHTYFENRNEKNTRQKFLRHSISHTRNTLASELAGINEHFHLRNWAKKLKS